MKRLAASLLVVLLMAILTGSASAAECTDSWTGAFGASWMEPGSWSAEHIPNSADVVCVPLATAVTIESGAAVADTLQGQGAVKVEAGSLTISGTEPSDIGTLRMEGGELKGGATLFVTSSMVSSGGTLGGLGTTVVGTGATAVVSDPEEEGRAGLRLLAKHTLRNKGELLVNGPAAMLAVLEGSTLENTSAMDVVGAAATLREQEAHIVNTGDLIGEGAASELRAEAGTVDDEGQLEFGPAGSRIVATEGAAVEVTGLIQGAGEMAAQSATLTISGAAEPSTVGSLRLEGAELRGAGTLFVTSALAVSGADMRGTGTTVVGTEATAVVTEPEEEVAALRLFEKHTLRNNGELLINGPAATVAVLEGSILENDSRLEIVGAESTLREQEAHIVNTGSLIGEGAAVELRADAGTLQSEGLLEFLPAGSRITGADGATLENAGELLVDGEGEGNGLVAGPGAAPALENLGLLSKGTGNYTSFVGFPIDNRGQVRAKGGEFAFGAGGTSGAGEKSWGGTFEEGRIVFEKGAFDLGDTVSLGGEIRILDTASVRAGAFEASESRLSDEEGVLEVAGTESATRFGRLDLIGSSFEVPEGGTVGAGFLALAEGSLTIAHGGRWSRGYVEQVGGSIEARPGSEFEAGYIDQVEGEISIEAEAKLSAEYVAKQGGAVHVAADATFAVENGWEQLGGSLTIGAGSTFVGETGFWQLAEGSQSFGAAVESNIHYFEQNAGELSVGRTNHFHVDNWNHRGGSTVVAPESDVFVRTLEQRHGASEFGHGSTIQGVNFLGVSGGKMVVGTESTVSGATAFVTGGGLELSGSSALSLSSNLSLYGGELGGAGDIESRTLSVSSGRMYGTGASTISEDSWIKAGAEEPVLDRRTLITEGEVHLESGTLAMGSGATWKTAAKFEANSETEAPGGQVHPVEGTLSAPKIINTGSVEKTEGSGTTTIGVAFENLGQVGEKEGHLAFADPIGRLASELFGVHCDCGDPIDTATGNFTEQQTDFSIGGRGAPLLLARSYSAQAAAAATSPGPFGYGWTIEYGDRLLLGEPGTATALLGSGATIPFIDSGGGTFAAPAWSKDSLAGTPETGYVLTLPGGTQEHFSGSGALQAVVDRNGNEASVEYDEAGRVHRIIDATGRAITLSYDEAGFVKSAEDPMGHVVHYTYESGDLKTVTLPGEGATNWAFAYDGSHRMTAMTDGRGGETTNEYDGSGRVIAQTDPNGRTLSMTYQPFHTTLTNEATGAVTQQWFNSDNEPFSITRGAGTGVATTETFAYTPAGLLAGKTDGNGHTTTYGYDGEGNRTSERDAEGDEKRWTYDEAHEVVSETTPSGEKTTIERDANGNPETISRPAPGEATQTVSYEYGPHGEVETMTDPLGHAWNYEYDGNGDLKAEIDPEGDKRTWTYDEDSRVLSTVSPRGNEEGAEPAEFTTSIERDPQGRPVKVLAPASGSVEYTYDADGNRESITDPNGHTTKFTYDADERQTKVERPDGTIEESGYDGAGQITGQTDGNGNTTTYVRNVLEQPVEVRDPLERTTTQTFDAAGHLRSKTDPEGRTTTYTYDKAGRLEGVTYSDGVTPGAVFGYDEDGHLTSMVDGTGESTYEYDRLGRLDHIKNGHGETAGWEYNLADQPIGLTYPNGKSIGRAYDEAGRLESVTDWLGHTTTFDYNRDSASTATSFPLSTGNTDEYGYDQADRMTSVRMKRGAESLASISYTRDPAGQLESTIAAGLPGPEEESFGYDQDERLTKAGPAEFGYDAANNLTEAPGTVNVFDKASEIESATGAAFSFDKEGERTKETPSSGPATTYGYDQAGNLNAVERPEEGETPAVAESFAYDGTGLMASRTAGATTTHLFWDPTESPELLLTDAEDSYVYGPGGLPIEQISAEEVPTYLHHDQLGSTRLLTNGLGETAATFTYGPYGGLTGHTGTAATPFGYAGQYTLGQSELQYLKARFYDPATGQFLTLDPAVGVTHEPYGYAGDNPLRFKDPTGLWFAEELGEVGIPCIPCEAAQEFLEPGYEDAVAGGNWVLNQLGTEELDEGDSSAEEVPCSEETRAERGTRRETREEEETFRAKEEHLRSSNPGNSNWLPSGPRSQAAAALIIKLLTQFFHGQG